MEKELCFKGTYEIRRLIKKEGPWAIFDVSKVTEPSSHYILIRFSVTANAIEDRHKYSQEFSFLHACKLIKNQLLPVVQEEEKTTHEELWIIDYFEGLPVSKVMEMGYEPLPLEKAIYWTIHYSQLLKTISDSGSKLWCAYPLESHIVLSSQGNMKLLPETFLHIIGGAPSKIDSSIPIVENYETTEIRSLISFLYFLLARAPLSAKKSYDEQISRLKNKTGFPEIDELIRCAIEGKDLPSSLNALISMLEMLENRVQTLFKKQHTLGFASKETQKQVALKEWKNQITFWIRYRILKTPYIKIAAKIWQAVLFLGNLFLEAILVLIKETVITIKKLRKLTLKDFKNIVKNQAKEAKQQCFDLVKNSKNIFKDIMIPLDQQLVVFTKELAMMLKAGVSYNRVLSILYKQSIKPSLQDAVWRIYVAVTTQGASISTGMAITPKIFTDTYINIVKAGEASGKIEDSLNKIADLLDKTLNIKRTVKTAMTYPIIVLCVCVLVFFIFANHVLPVFLTLFESSNIPLPLPTKILMGFIKYIHNPKTVWFSIIVGIIFLGPLFHYRRNILGAVLYDKLKFRIPIIGKIIKLVALSQFCRTLASMYACGINLIQAVEISGKSVGNAYLLQITNEMGEAIRAGASLPDMFSSHELFPKFVYHMARVGDETGEVQEMLEKVSVMYDQEVERGVEVLIAMLDPILIGILGVIVCFVVLALFLPLYQILNIF